MAYETKVFLSSLARNIAKVNTVEVAYNEVVAAASVEDVSMTTYEELKKKFESMERKGQ